VRNTGFELLKAKGAKAIKPVKKVLQEANPYHQARAVWLLAQLGLKGIAEVEILLDHPNPDIRITAFRALKQTNPGKLLTYAARLAKDESAALRREVAVALQDVPLDRSQVILTDLIQGYDGKDRWYLEALGLALEGKEEIIYPPLIANAGNPLQWNEPTANLVWRLHPIASVEALKARANAPALPESERKKALVALGFIKDTKAAQAMTELSKSTLADVAEQAYWWLKFRQGNDWLTLLNWEQTFADDQLALREKMYNLQLQVMDKNKPTPDRTQAALEMAKDKIGGQMLISLVSDKKLPLEVNEAVGSAIFLNPDQTVRVLAGDYFTRPGNAKTLSVTQINQLKAFADKGKVLFGNNCGSCHKHGDKGGEIGPDLTQIHKKLDKTSLLDAIINPSAGMAFGYEPWIIKTKKGSSFYGFLMADGPTVVIKDAAGGQHVFKSVDIESRKQLTTSLMPDPASLGLTEQDLADVVQYLLTASKE
jgi:putative heme-binding domain-containing protein